MQRPDGETQPPVDDQWSSIYVDATTALNTPSGMVRLPATVVMRLVTALREAEKRADEAALRSIEASNPGIDMDEVRAHYFGSTLPPLGSDERPYDRGAQEC